MAENQPRRDGIDVSPGREPWVGWKIVPSPGRGGTAFHLTSQHSAKSSVFPGVILSDGSPLLRTGVEEPLYRH